MLREAAAQGDVEYLKELLETGGNPCSTDDNGLNALHFAVWNGHVEAVELLVVNDVGCPTLPANTRAKLEDAKSKWLQGYIARDNHDGTYDVNFEDGSSEQAIEKRKIRQAEKEDGTLYPKPKEGKAWKVNMICLARYSHKRDTSNLVSTDGSYGGAAFNQEQYDAEQAIAAAKEHLEQLEKNRLKKKPQASCVTGVTEAGWSALHICAMGSLNDVECAQILLEAGVSPLMPVWKSKFHVTFASTSTPSTRRLLDGVAISAPHRSGASAPDALVDFHTGINGDTPASNRIWAHSTSLSDPMAQMCSADHPASVTPVTHEACGFFFSLFFSNCSRCC